MVFDYYNIIASYRYIGIVVVVVVFGISKPVRRGILNREIPSS